MNPTVEDITKRGYIGGPDGARYELGSQEATDYLLKPVSVLSTDNAATTVEKRLDSLNSLSPTTKPGYTAPAPTGEPAPLPKAFFTNEAGQEAEYTEAQLRDEATRKFIQDGGYVMTRTEGPSLQAGELSVVNAKLEGLVNEITTYNVDADPGFKMQADSIKAEYAKLKTEMELANKQRAGAISTLGIRGGTSRYAGGVQQGIEGEELRQAGERLNEITRQEANAVSAARSAYQTGKFSQFNTQVAALEKIQTNKQKELEEFNKKLVETRKKVEETTIRASRDGVIASLLAQGVTDASEMLDYLNYNDAGEQVGDFTAKEVGDTLKLLAPGADLKNLTGTVKEFYALKGEGALPESITSLPEDEQFFTYLKMKKEATAAPAKPGKKGVTPGVKTITEAQARARGLPYSVVGSSEQEIINSLQSTTTPAWFKEKYLSEQGDPATLDATWNTYRIKVNNVSSKAATPTKSNNPYAR